MKEKIKPKASIKIIIKLRNEIENSKTAEEINETKNRFSGKINKTDRPIARLTKKIERRHKLSISEMEKKTSLWIHETLNK